MQKTLSVLLICTLILSVLLSFTSCGKKYIPSGNYVCDYEESGIQRSVSIRIKDNYLYKVNTENDKPPYIVFEVYTYTLNKDKTEISITFVGYKFEGDNEGYGRTKMLEKNYDAGRAHDLLATKDKASVYLIEVGSGYFILNGQEYIIEK